MTNTKCTDTSQCALKPGAQSISSFRTRYKSYTYHNRKETAIRSPEVILHANALGTNAGIIINFPEMEEEIHPLYLIDVEKTEILSYRAALGKF